MEFARVHVLEAWLHLIYQVEIAHVCVGASGCHTESLGRGVNHAMFEVDGWMDRWIDVEIGR